jgi:hypothetical protein
MHRIHIHTTAVRTIQRRPSSDRSPLQPSSRRPPQHGSFQVAASRRRALTRLVLLLRASQITVRCGSWFRICKCSSRLVYPSHPDPFIHTRRPDRTRLRHPRHPPADPYRDATAARGSHAASPRLCIVLTPPACQTLSPLTSPMRPDLPPYNPSSPGAAEISISFSL